MPFHMPVVSIQNVSHNVACIFSEITDQNWRLVTCPRYSVHDWVKLFHNTILRELYSDHRWSVPVWWAWGMPHTVVANVEEAQQILSPVVKQMIKKGVFKDPQPVHKGNKIYLITNPDETTYEFKVQ